MRFDGMEFKRANHIVFRHSKEGDVDDFGNQLGNAYIAFCYLKDCKVDKNEFGEIEKVDPSNAPAIVGGHSLTNMMYGKPRKRKNPFLKPVWDARKREMVYVDEYWTTPVYLAKDGWVYTSTIQNVRNPHEGRKNA
jgi:hypothetical protein